MAAGAHAARAGFGTAARFQKAAVHVQRPMAVRFVNQYDERIHDTRRFWLVDVVYRNEEGVRRRVRRVAPVSSERGAREWERRLIAELESSARKPTDRLSLRDFVEWKFMPVYPSSRGNRPSTVREKESHLRCHILPRLGALALREVDAGKIDRFSADLVTGGLSPKTVSNVLMTLGTVLRTACRWGVIATYPRIEAPRSPQREMSAYSRREAAGLLSAAFDGVSYIPLLLALHAGLRAGEILALRWEAVDLASRALVIRRSRTRDVDGPTKSGRERVLPMSRELTRALSGANSGTGRIVSGRDGSALTLHDLHRFLSDACERAGVRRLRFHDLRHTFATHAAAAGVPLRILQEWLGHADLRMVVRYTHPSTALGCFQNAIDQAVVSAAPSLRLSASRMESESAAPFALGTGSGGEAIRALPVAQRDDATTRAS